MAHSTRYEQTRAAVTKSRAAGNTWFKMSTDGRRSKAAQDNAWDMRCAHRHIQNVMFAEFHEQVKAL